MKSQIIEHPELVAGVIPREFTAAEVEWAESNYPALSPSQPANFCAEFETADGIRGLELSSDRLAQIQREFLTAAGWHEAFRRAELSAKYRRLADNVRQSITRKLN